jgi:hypothetical protein
MIPKPFHFADRLCVVAISPEYHGKYIPPLSLFTLGTITLAEYHILCDKPDLDRRLYIGLRQKEM